MISSTQPSIRMRVNFYVCLGFSLTVIASSLFSDLLSVRARTISIAFAITLAAYVLLYIRGITPIWTEQCMGLLASAVLTYFTFFGAPDFGIVVMFVVVPAFAFLCYSPSAATMWTSLLFVVMVYALFVGGEIPQSAVSDRVRMGLLAAYLAQFVICCVSTYVNSYYEEQLSKANRRIHTLEQILPLCMDCKLIRHDDDWLSIETYLKRIGDIQVSHGFCPSCGELRLRELSEAPPRD